MRSVFDAKDLETLVAGSVLFGAALQIFLAPSGVISGGFSGIATVLYRLYGLPVGLCILLLNLPFLAADLLLYGKAFLRKAIVGIAATAAMTEFFRLLPITPPKNRLVCAVIGGILMGIGCGLLLRRSFTTGGTDLVAYLVLYVFPGLPLGNILLLLDGAVLLFGATAMHDAALIPVSAIGILLYAEAVNLLVQGETALYRLLRRRK